MADSSEQDQERTLPATPRRLEQAREEGQVPRSRALATALVFTAAGITFWSAGPLLADRYVHLFTSGLALDHATTFEGAALLDRLAAATFQAALFALPLCVVLAVPVVLAAFLLGGWNFSTQSLEPKWSRLNPIAGLANMVSLPALAELAKTLVEMAAVVAVLGGYLWVNRDTFSALVTASSHAPLGMLANSVLVGFALVVVVLAFAAAIDVPLQLWRYGRRLRMSLEEVKRESRESEGDPQLKARVKSAQRELAKKRMMQAVPQADVVITNPTHYAVALAYEEGKSDAPRVVAKGMHLLAERIRTLAADAHVPIVEAPPLARALYAKAEIGDEIPQALYTAVAQGLAFVFRLRAARSDIAREPYALDDLDVPAGLDPLEGEGAA